MRAILIAADHLPGLPGSSDESWCTLPPLVDRPFIQHSFEAAVRAGARRIDLLAGTCAEQIRDLFGDGRRWGVQVNHVPGDMRRPCSELISGDGDPEERILLGYLEQLPALGMVSTDTGGGVVLYGWREAGSGRTEPVWTGWAVIPASALLRLRETGDPHELLRLLLSGDFGTPQWHEVPPPLSATSYHGLLEANRRVLAGENPGLLLTGREASPGIRLGRNVTIHPAAKLVPPIFVGENSRIEEDVLLGPSVVVGKDCLIARGSSLSDAVVCQGTYVGQGLSIERSVAERNRLVNVDLGVEIEEMDEVLLGPVYDRSGSAWLPLMASRLAAMLLLLLFLPVLAGLWVSGAVRAGGKLGSVTVVRAPAASEPERWQALRIPQFSRQKSRGNPDVTAFHPGKGFFSGFLPALLPVLRGEIDLAGRQPLTRDALVALDPSERSRYLRSRLGLFSCDLEPGALRNGEAAMPGLRLLVNYLTRGAVNAPVTKGSVRRASAWTKPGGQAVGELSTKPESSREIPWTC